MPDTDLFKPEVFGSDDDKITKFKLDIISDADVVDQPRLNANSDMRFVNIDGGMWEEFLTDDFDAERVRLEMDLISNYLQRFIGEWNQNRVGVEYKPNDAGTTKEDAELLNGIYRSDFRQHSGKLSTDNAVDECATCGYGAMKLATAFENPEDPDNDDMHVEWRPIYNSYNTVIWDQSAQRIDKRDARWVSVLAQFTRSSFESAYPDKDPVSAYIPDNRISGEKQPDQIDIVYIATRYEVVKRRSKMHIYNNLKTGKIESYEDDDHDLIKDELAADEFKSFRRTRAVIVQSVEKTVFSGEDILDDTRRIAGKWIPIIPFYAYRSYVDGVEQYRGLIRKLKDAARLFNMQVSQLAENSASAGQEVPIFDPDQVEGPDMDAIWADKNNKPYLLARSLRDADGNILQSGPLGYSKPPQLDGSTTALLAIVPNFIQDVTGVHPSEAFNREMSGKLFNAIVKRENLNTQVVTDNIKNAIAWSGEVYQSIAAEVYTSNRIVKTIAKDGTEGEVRLSEQVMDEETGVMVEANTLAGKRFQSYPDVGPQYETLREQTVDDLKSMIETLGPLPSGQQYIPVIMSVLMDNITGVGLDPIKTFNRRIMLGQGLVKPENEEEEKILAQLQQPQEDPNRELIEAAANQQNAEARNLDSDSVDNIASARKKAAETRKIMSEVGTSAGKLLIESQKAARQGLGG